MYTIYKGLKPDGTWKIGCDQEYPNRAIEQSLTQYFAIEQYDDIMIASEREIELQKEHGVRVDPCPYWQTKINASNAAKNSLRNGTHNFQNGHGRKGWVSKEVQLRASRLGGLSQKGKAKAKTQCPHCKKFAAAHLIDRWHNDNCKNK